MKPMRILMKPCKLYYPLLLFKLKSKFYLRISINDVEYDEYEDEPIINSQKLQVEDYFNGNITNLKIKLVITEINQTGSGKKLRQLVSPIMNQIPALRKDFGLFHTSLVIGPW